MHLAKVRTARGRAAVAVLSVLMTLPAAAFAASCTTQAELTPQDRDALAAAGQRLSTAIVQQDFSALQAALLPAVASEWDGIRGVVEQNAPVVKGGTVKLRSLYLLDATTLTAPADTQFFCSNASGSLTVTISMRSLPQGKYALVLADAAGSALGGQMALILAWDANAWKLGGVFVRAGILGGHDGVWYWQRARDLAKADSPWAAWYSYETARYLLLPVEFLTSPNLEKLTQEQLAIKGSPQDAFPYMVAAGDRSWKMEGVRLDTTLREADLGVTYDSTGVTDPAALRTEALSVMSALLKAQPALRQSFHGIWAYASDNGKITPVIELPMAQIP